MSHLMTWWKFGTRECSLSCTRMFCVRTPLTSYKGMIWKLLLRKNTYFKIFIIINDFQPRCHSSKQVSTWQGGLGILCHAGQADWYWIYISFENIDCLILKTIALKPFYLCNMYINIYKKKQNILAKSVV